jgi:hypothetical protein
LNGTPSSENIASTIVTFAQIKDELRHLCGVSTFMGWILLLFPLLRWTHHHLRRFFINPRLIKPLKTEVHGDCHIEFGNATTRKYPSGLNLKLVFEPNIIFFVTIPTS